MQAIILQVLRTVGGLVLQMLLGLLLSPKYLYSLLMKGLHWAVEKTSTDADDRALAEAEEEWRKQGIPEKDPAEK